MNLMGALTSIKAANHSENTPTTNKNSQSNPDSLQDNFLTMLTTELKNQDPMNPMDSSQMVTQLSQISTSQGISDLKKLSQSEIMALMGQQRLASSQLIGKHVDYQINQLSVKDDKKSFSGTAKAIGGGSGDITITIKDQYGNDVRHIKVPKGADGDYDWQWDGKDDNGKSVENSNYTISASTDTGDAEVLLSDSVKRVDFSASGETRLIFDDGESTSISNVTSIEDEAVA